MKLTKYGHACVFIEKNNQKLVIDPGEFTELPEDLENIVAVLCTHMHADHTYTANLLKILALNPDVVVIAHPQSMAEITEVSATKTPIESTQVLELGDFRVKIEVLDHAVIWKTSPCKNLTVLVDGFYYTPGDSFTVSEDAVKIAGVPTSAPWLKMSEAIEYTRFITAEYIVPIHNGLLNDIGHGSTNNWLKVGLEGTDKTLRLLKNGESLEL